MAMNPQDMQASADRIRAMRQGPPPGAAPAGPPAGPPNPVEVLAGVKVLLVKALELLSGIGGGPGPGPGPGPQGMAA